MNDKFSVEKRRQIMQSIRSKDTKIEIAVRKKFYNSGLRYRKNCRDILGTPDISIKKYKVAVFINGCFWHGHKGCKRAVIPKTRTEYWRQKIDDNRKRDEKVKQSLAEDGWNVYTLWECDLLNNFDEHVDNIIADVKMVIQKQKTLI